MFFVKNTTHVWKTGTAALNLYESVCTLTHCTHQQATSWSSLPTSKDHSGRWSLPRKVYPSPPPQHDLHPFWLWKTRDASELTQPESPRSAPGSSLTLKSETLMSKKRGSRDRHFPATSWYFVLSYSQTILHFRIHWSWYNYWAVVNTFTSSWSKPWYSLTTSIKKNVGLYRY